MREGGVEVWERVVERDCWHGRRKSEQFWGFWQVGLLPLHRRISYFVWVAPWKKAVSVSHAVSPAARGES